MANKSQTQLESVIQTAIETALKEVHTCLPAVVTSTDRMNEQLIDCQLTIKRKLAGQLVLLPLLVNVPIRYFKSSTFSVTFPIEIGDHVMIIFSERSIDTWLTQGGLQAPFDVRRHALSDAFAIPMMYPQTDIVPNFDTDNLQIKTNSGNTKITVDRNEGIDIFSTGNVDVTCANMNINCNVLDIECTSLNVNAANKIDITAATTIDVIANTNIEVTTPTTNFNGNVASTGTMFCVNLDASDSLVVDGQEQKEHVHEQGADSDGDTEQDTGPPKDGP